MLGELSWTFMEDQIDGELFVFCHRDPIVCIRYLLSQTAYSGEMVIAPVKELNAAGERMYSELHTADWWWNIQVGPDPTEAGVMCLYPFHIVSLSIVCLYPFHYTGIIYILISHRRLF
jgi:hypothetical protein